MIFSRIFDITKTSDDDWFDPILSIDTKLFIDPFLIFATKRNKYYQSMCYNTCFQKL